MIACKKTQVNFSYSPAAPKIGESVQFTNLSSSGEEWEWQFGDGATTTIKNPSHVFKKPTTFKVTLSVDKKKRLRCTKEIEIYDSIPTFVCSDTTFEIYQDYTFTAHYYNPYNYDYTFIWTINDSVVSRKPSFTTYFTTPFDSVTISMRMILMKDTLLISRKYFVDDQETNSILLRTPEEDYRQRIFGERAEPAKPDFDAEELLDAEQDTAQFYSGFDFTISYFKEYLPEIEGFHIHNRKIYYRGNGLWVANIDGANQVQIDSMDCHAMTLDFTDSRIYWANDSGVWYMPFIGSDNNKYVYSPTRLNKMTTITKLAADSEKR